MSRGKFIKVLGVVLVIFFIAVVGLVLPKVINQPNQVDISVQAPVEQTISLTFQFNDEAIEYLDVQINQGESLGDVLVRFTQEKDIDFSYQDYGGDLGIFFKSIFGVGDDGSDKWWQYWVNGEYSQVGVSGYSPSAGDNIIFKFTDSHEE